jgi:hypothetical protein
MHGLHTVLQSRFWRISPSFRADRRSGILLDSRPFSSFWVLTRVGGKHTPRSNWTLCYGSSLMVVDRWKQRVQVIWQAIDPKQYRYGSSCISQTRWRRSHQLAAKMSVADYSLRLGKENRTHGYFFSFFFWIKTLYGNLGPKKRQRILNLNTIAGEPHPRTVHGISIESARYKF